MLTKKSRLLLALTAATPLLFAACSDNPFNPINDAAGTYQLTVYAGRSMTGGGATFLVQPGDPNFPNFPNGGTIRVTDGTFVLNTNGTFTETNNLLETPQGQASFNDAFVSTGTWTLNGNALSFSAPAQNQGSARFVTGTLELGRINYQEDDGSGTVQSYEYQKL